MTDLHVYTLNNQISKTVSTNECGICDIAYTKKGLIHRDNDLPAMIQIFIKTDTVLTKIWYQNGCIHRDNDLPAVIQYSSVTGNIITLKWYNYHKLHRDNDLPACIIYDINGNNIIHKEWYINGISTRDNWDLPDKISFTSTAYELYWSNRPVDEPKKISYDDDGTCIQIYWSNKHHIEYIRYYISGNVHSINYNYSNNNIRSIHYYRTGEISLKEFFKFDENTPKQIIYYKNGVVKQEKYQHTTINYDVNGCIVNTT